MGDHYNFCFTHHVCIHFHNADSKSTSDSHAAFGIVGMVKRGMFCFGVDEFLFGISGNAEIGALSPISLKGGLITVLSSRCVTNWESTLLISNLWFSCAHLQPPSLYFCKILLCQYCYSCDSDTVICVHLEQFTILTDI